MQLAVERNCGDFGARRRQRRFHRPIAGEAAARRLPADGGNQAEAPHGREQHSPDRKNTPRYNSGFIGHGVLLPARGCFSRNHRDRHFVIHADPPQQKSCGLSRQTELGQFPLCPARLGGMPRAPVQEPHHQPFVVVDRTMDRRRTFMSDYRNSDYDYRNDPLRRDPAYDPDARAMNATWGWIAAAIFIVVVLAVAFGIGHEPNQLGTSTASNDVTP